MWRNLEPSGFWMWDKPKMIHQEHLTVETSTTWTKGASNQIQDPPCSREPSARRWPNSVALFAAVGGP